jgi:hypothetical protein
MHLASEISEIGEIGVISEIGVIILNVNKLRH